MEAIKELPGVTDDMLKGISCFICGNENMTKALETEPLMKSKKFWKYVSL